MRNEWVSCPPDEITWLDRDLLSGNQDLTLHRAPRCAALRYVHHRWELFSRDTTYRVYLAPHASGAIPGPPRPCSGPLSTSCRRPRRTTRHCRWCWKREAWLISVGTWVLPLRLETPARVRSQADRPAQRGEPATQDGRVLAPGRGTRPAAPDKRAVAHVRSYFERNATARMAMAYYYQEYILGLPAPHTTAMMDVVIALNLSGEGAVSDYKKLLQGFIWKERGHARDLADFLLSNGLLTPVDLDQARQVAADNERSGICEMASASGCATG